MVLASLLTILLLIPISLSSFAQKKPTPPDKLTNSDLDPASIALRDKMLKAYHELNSFHEKVTQKQWKNSPDISLTIEVEFRFRKPNKLYLDVDYPEIVGNGRWHLIYVCDGKTLLLYNSSKQEYQKIKAPATLERLVLPSALRGPEFEAILRENNPFAPLEKSAIVRYSESYQTSQNDKAHILKLEVQEDGAKRTLRYFLDARDNLVRNLSLLIVPNSDTASPFLDPETASTVEATYNLVEINPRFTTADFIFTPPSDAKEKAFTDPDKTPEKPKRGRK